MIVGSYDDTPNGFVKVIIFYVTVHYAEIFILTVEVRVQEAALFRVIVDGNVILIYD